MTRSFHEPNNPRYANLLQMIKPIIPNAFPKPTQEPEHPNIQVVKSVLNTTEEMYKKLDGVDPHRKALLEKVIQEGKQLLDSVQSKLGYKSTGGGVSDSERNNLLKTFARALKGPETESQPKAKAPFSKLGEDGFEDVDHQILAMEIKRLAVSLAQYLKERMRESLMYTQNGDDLDDPAIKVKYETDYVLTQTTAIMAKLHRAILRNHHHILMVIGNFAGNAASAGTTTGDKMLVESDEDDTNVSRDITTTPEQEALVEESNDGSSE